MTVRGRAITSTSTPYAAAGSGAVLPATMGRVGRPLGQGVGGRRSAGPGRRLRTRVGAGCRSPDGCGLLTGSDDLAGEVEGYLDARRGAITGAAVFGGTQAISEQVATDVEAPITPAATGQAP